MTEPLPLSHAAERPGKDDLLAVLRVEKALYAALEAEARSPGLGRIGGDSFSVSMIGPATQRAAEPQIPFPAARGSVRRAGDAAQMLLADGLGQGLQLTDARRQPVQFLVGDLVEIGIACLDIGGAQQFIAALTLLRLPLPDADQAFVQLLTALGQKVEIEAGMQPHSSICFVQVCSARSEPRSAHNRQV
jgi:hypothetical protein